jgi:hypothetical protein
MLAKAATSGNFVRTVAMLNIAAMSEETRCLQGRNRVPIPVHSVVSAKAVFLNVPNTSEPMAYLYDPHGQAGLLRELFPYVSGGFRSLRESRLQDLQLLGLDCGTRTPSL